MGREVSLFIIMTTGKHAGSVLVYHHLPVVGVSYVEGSFLQSFARFFDRNGKAIISIAPGMNCCWTFYGYILCIMKGILDVGFPLSRYVDKNGMGPTRHKENVQIIPP